MIFYILNIQITLTSREKVKLIILQLIFDEQGSGLKN